MELRGEKEPEDGVDFPTFFKLKPLIQSLGGLLKHQSLVL